MALLREVQRHMEPDVITYSATISACTKGQQWSSAVALLREMLQDHIKHDVITYTATISACERGPDRGQGERNTITCIATISACGKEDLDSGRPNDRRT